ncbi:MAG: N-acetylneuraminate synthase family protein [Spirochaetaceae bacterium]|jgi:sialic acid synthase SpsE|nr:N-acetylneuraminate synthase family protein [Spirochaetaceae bacterium]
MNSSVCICGRLYSRTHPLIIAELGTSHGGDISKAREMIDAAVQAGADCIKTQIVYADEILHPYTGEVPLPGGSVRLYDIFKSLEAPLDFYVELKLYAESKNVLFLASPFGPRSTAELLKLHPDFIKIASPELNWPALLGDAAAARVPLLLSSGVSKLADIEQALDALDDAGLSREMICLLHCVTAYPAPAREYNLAVLPHLTALFGVASGVSDHSAEPTLVPLLALSQGAAVIEKHFCLARSAGGLDDPIALTAGDFTMMCRAVRSAALLSSEEIVTQTEAEFGKATVQAVLGDGIKKLAPAERAHYTRTNRSIHALRFIARGELLTRECIAVLRTEKVLRPGLAPAWYEHILGRRAGQDIPAGEGVRLEDI